MKPILLFMLMIWFGCGSTESIVADQNQKDVNDVIDEKEELTLSFFLDGRNRIFYQKEEITEEKALQEVQSFIDMETNTNRAILVNRESKTSIDRLNDFKTTIEGIIITRKNGLAQRLFGLDYASISKEDAIVIDKMVPVKLK